MSAETTPVSESRSSVEIAENAKREPIIKVKCYAATTEIDAITAAAEMAIRTYRDVKANVL